MMVMMIITLRTLVLDFTTHDHQDMMMIVIMLLWMYVSIHIFLEALYGVGFGISRGVIVH